MLSLKSTVIALSAAIAAAALSGCSTIGMSDLEKVEAELAEFNPKLSRAQNICRLFAPGCVPDSEGPVEAQSSSLGSATATLGFHGADIAAKGFTGVTGTALGFGLAGLLFSGGDGVSTVPLFTSFVPLKDAATYTDARIAAARQVSDALNHAYRKQGFETELLFTGKPYGKYVFAFIKIVNESKGCPKDLECQASMIVFNSDHSPGLENPIRMPSWLGQTEEKFYLVNRAKIEFRWNEKKVKKPDIQIDWDRLWVDTARELPQYTYLYKAPRKLDYRKYTTPAMLTKDEAFFFVKPPKTN